MTQKVMGFFMVFSEALARTSINRLTKFSSLSDTLKPEIIEPCLSVQVFDLYAYR